ncbi:MAG: hypothetical protein KZQ86_00495 [Candidatus Thiodiazotropha sp. (ex Lucinoma kastoroae)]|nr:hypothetical protein [Candidatus Thiodiazotropha sp. (ex Lucinoma kastoroae)]
MSKSYRLKNVYCKNTKLSEEEFSQVVWDYCGFVPASVCAEGVGRSRQTVQGIYSKLGERLTYMFESNDFPNFSSSIAIEMMEDEKLLRHILSIWITPKVYELCLIYEYDPLPDKGKHQNLVIVKRTETASFLIRIFDHHGEIIDYYEIPDCLIMELENEFREPSKGYENKKEFIEKVMSALCYTQSDIRMYDELVPKFSYDAYKDYRNRGAVLNPNNTTVYNSRYRIINYMIRTEKFMRGFSKKKYSNYFSRARLLELMIFMCSWARRKHNVLKNKEIKEYARDVSFALIMLSLRYRPL